MHTALLSKVVVLFIRSCLALWATTWSACCIILSVIRLQPSWWNFCTKAPCHIRSVSWTLSLLSTKKILFWESWSLLRTDKKIGNPLYVFLSNQTYHNTFSAVNTSRHNNRRSLSVFFKLPISIGPVKINKLSDCQGSESLEYMIGSGWGNTFKVRKMKYLLMFGICCDARK